MKFRTEISISQTNFNITHDCKIAMHGSCFAENIAMKFANAGFSIDLNPFGIAYNPLSLSQNLNRLLDNKPFMENELIKINDLYHSFSHHSRFSGINPTEVLEKINSRLEQSSTFLRTANLLIITFGTAYVYRLQSTGNVVSNCHKLPDKLFTYKRLTIDEIIGEWNGLIIRLQSFNPSLRLLFTVSPIRHWKDGAHENQISKSILLLSVDELIRNHLQCCYFPAYELLMDDLRDYRFYSEDMIHPSLSAIEYIWNTFANTFFDNKTLKLNAAIDEIVTAKNHRLKNPFSEESKRFKEEQLKKIQRIQTHSPHINFEDEIKYFSN